jgi:hypothetical protein
MKNLSRGLSAALFLTFGYVATVFAQGMPTKQPALLSIVREDVKVGRAGDHAKHEAGWPAAYEKSKSPYYYVAMTSLTGPSEALYVSPFESHAAVGDSMKRDDADPVLSAELARLSRADAEYLNGSRVIQAMARTDLSMGAYPDMSKARFYQISFVRVRPGQETRFEEAAKAYRSAAVRLGSDPRVRIYQVIAGMPGPTFVLFSSVEDYAAFDKMMTDGRAITSGMNAEEKAAFQKFGAEGLLSAETNRYRLDPAQSYVDKETRAKDPAFWMAK